MGNNSNYIPPNITKYPSFKELLNDKDPYGYFGINKGTQLSFDDLLSHRKVFIITEPGHGKTRLLKELVVKAEESRKQAVFIDLKKTKGNLKDFILRKIKEIDVLNPRLDLQSSSLFRTKTFTLKNNAKTVVCLDALDEVRHEEFPDAVDSIKQFSKRYKNISLFVSCRYHHFLKYQELFTDVEFDYMKIELFTREQVHIYFEREGILKEDIEKIIQILEFRHRNLIIQTPRYLEMMAAWIKDKGIDNLRKLKKTEIFEWFIYKKLDIEGRKLGFQKKEIIKRVLEKIALLMEMYQTNILKKDELITIFDDVKSNLNISFLQQVPIEFFYERTVLKDNIDTVEFENTEFQEYLAAKEILRLGRTDQIVFDLAIDQELQEIFPSWFNTLGFLVDLEISLLKLLLDFGASKSKIVQDEEYHRFLTKVDVHRLTVEERRKIFGNIFTYYQQILHWIPYDVARNLSYYFDVSQEGLLKKSIVVRNERGAENFVRKGNVAYIVGFLLEKGIFNESQKEYWRDKLIKFAKDKNQNGVLQRHSLFALGKFKDIKLLKKVSHLMTSTDELIIQSFIESCIEVDPNNFFSIAIFIEGTKKKNIHARYGLYQIKEKWGVKKLLDYYIKDEQFLFQFIDQENIFKDRDGEIIHNIRNVWDDEIKKKLHQIIITAFSSQFWYQAEKSRLIKDIVFLLAEKDEDYIFSLLKSIKNNGALQKNLFSLEHIFALLLKKRQVGKFIVNIEKLEHGKNIALGTLREINISTRGDAKDIYEEGKKYFRKEYEQLEEIIRKRAGQPGEEQRIYKEFQFKLEPERGKYNPGVFQFYLDNKKKINKRMTPGDKKRLKGLIINSIFAKFDPGKQRLTITKRESGGGTSYTTHAWIPIFGDCIVVAQELGINISKFRQRIINYIPFAYSDHLQAIFSLVKNPKSQELNSLLEIYSEERKDDLPRFMPYSFIDACKNYEINDAIPILKRFVEQTDFPIYERRSALEAIVNIRPEKEYLKRIFKQYKNQNNEIFQLAEEANKYLVEKFSDEAAIKWRFKQLKKRASPFTRPKGGHWVSDFESELWDKKFAKPLIELKDPGYRGKFLDLLDTSFKILKKGENYWSYATYLWEIVVTYFDNLKETRSYVYLKDLERHIEQISTLEGINWFKGKLKELRRKYMDYIGKPQNITECIKQYNKLKEVQYLDIVTPRDLMETVKDVVGKDLTHFVVEEGFYRVIKDAKGKQEDLIQKTLKTQLENGLLKRGFRENEVNIRREEQLLDNSRTDFLISYGFMGPVLIEIKRTDNKEVTLSSDRKKYKTKLLQYIKGYKAHFGLFILFQIKEEYPLEKYLPMVRNIYKDCKLIEVIGLNCLRAEHKGINKNG
jgi:hypothetical protein